MTDDEKTWLSNIYYAHIIPAKIRDINVLHCDHWSRVVYQHISALKYKVILANDQHAVCCIDGILVDLELNAFITDWGWNTSSIPLNTVLMPICSSYAIKRVDIANYYSKKATKLFKIDYKEVFLPKKDSHLNILT